jgi:hypothetical protein
MRKATSVLVLTAFLAACTHPRQPTLHALQSHLESPTWDSYEVVPIGGTGTPTMGADGTHTAIVAGKLSVCTGWEQGGAVTVAALDGSTTNPVVGANPGTEDVKCVDVDGDGSPDAVSASEGGKKIKIQWGPGWTTSTVITAATNVNRWMQIAWGDALHTGPPVLIGGGKNAAPNFTTSTWGYFTVDDHSVPPNGANPREAGDWTWHPVAAIGWTMALKLVDMDGDGDLDVFLTDRSGQTGNQGPTKGAWWYELLPGQVPSWVPHQIAQITGDPSFGDAGDLDGDGDIDVVAGNRTTIKIYTNDGNGGWVAGNNIYPTGVGDGHGLVICDINSDGTEDILATFALSQIGESWVAWLEQNGTAHDISGPATVIRKPDQPSCVDANGDGSLDAVISEGGDGVKTDDLGVLVFKNPMQLSACFYPYRGRRKSLPSRPSPSKNWDVTVAYEHTLQNCRSRDTFARCLF